MGSWTARAILICLTALLLVSSLYLGYIQEIPLDEARNIYSENSNYIKGLIVPGDAESTALNLFIDFSPVVLGCNTPFLGPAVAFFVSYYSGYSLKAEYIVTGKDVFSASLLDPVSILQLVALAVAGGEGMFLSYVVWKRQRADLFETLAVIFLEISLAVLAATIQAFQAMF
ncbi:MAG: hypothetical protein ABWK01_05685 [Infirmifilum sp.]